MHPLFTQWSGPLVLPGGMILPPLVIGLLFSFGILDVILKGWALWRAARMDKPYWFVVLLLVNSLGILPGLFILFTDVQYNRMMKPKRKR